MSWERHCPTSQCSVQGLNSTHSSLYVSASPGHLPHDLHLEHSYRSRTFVLPGMLQLSLVLSALFPVYYLHQQSWIHDLILFVSMLLGWLWNNLRHWWMHLSSCLPVSLWVLLWETWELYGFCSLWPCLVWTGPNQSIPQNENGGAGSNTSVGRSAILCCYVGLQAFLQVTHCLM